MQNGALPPAEKPAYEIEKSERILTPALVVYPELVARNCQTMLRLLGGNASRWRPHIKTAKLASTVRILVEHGILELKCATTLELLTACSAGAKDVLVAYPAGGAAVQRIRDIANAFPDVSVSALVESPAMIEPWAGSSIGLFIDINPGMDRTGIEQERVPEIVGLAQAIGKAKLHFRGLHYYDGHLSGLALVERTAVAHRGYDQLMKIAAAVRAKGIAVEQVITSGTPETPCALSYPGFAGAGFHHQVSPGTLVYGDSRCQQELPPDWGIQPAALVLAHVVSHPKPGVVTCDAGHKTVAVDAGVPNCRVLGHDELLPGKPSEEHLPMEVAAGRDRPAVGELLYLLPRHICPTVNNFDFALIVEQGKITRLDRVTARGRENPLILSASRQASAG
ncbi:MAG TPA: alanine racemase [Candidatus Acidoferrales bacterium]|nr:alanine racemase [Candidatus Acidoferrales bacterium]